MAITPASKDWTWVLERRCRECGFDAGAADFDDIPRQLRENAAALRLRLILSEDEPRFDNWDQDP
ncbi:MAG: methyltransferase type 12 [Microbacteriaceae bacterium]|jgi:hypothetical protein|nr:methyltransferase type 12 [Microbacteriaceae bacterium]HEV7955895.1 hypothetical protein [Marisediminicola sp.]